MRLNIVHHTCCICYFILSKLCLIVLFDDVQRRHSDSVGKNNIFPEKISDNGGLQLAAKDSLLLLLLYLHIQPLRNHTCKKET